MTWEQKLAALQVLAETSIRMRSPGDWYVSANMQIGSKDSCLLVGTYGNGATPQEAVENHWNKYAMNLPADQYLVVGVAPYKCYRWGEYMWCEVHP